MQSSGGSQIPNDLKEIEIIDLGPVFFLNQKININNGKGAIRYKIKPIGEGSYADVFKYKDEYYNKHFVIKRAKSDLRKEEYERFILEFQEIKKLKSPYIIEVYNFDEDNRQYTMEYMDMTLEKYILENNNKLDIKDRVNIVGQILKAIDYIHSKNILHRDISTKNVLIKKYEDVVVVKLSDFGLVKLPESDLTRRGTEIKGYFNDHKNLEIVGFDNYNIKHEIYAITKLIYFVMTGKSRLERYDKTPFKNFIERGIADNLNERYENVTELKNALNETVKNLK
ncbi:protein kinase [Clostridium perfringens]|nr:protein kinase [Clostridium perfringens]